MLLSTPRLLRLLSPGECVVRQCDSDKGSSGSTKEKAQWKMKKTQGNLVEHFQLSQTPSNWQQFIRVFNCRWQKTPAKRNKFTKKIKYSTAQTECTKNHSKLHSFPRTVSRSENFMEKRKLMCYQMYCFKV